MPVVIQDFEAVQEEGPVAEGGGAARLQPGPVANAALDRLLVVHRARHMRLWAN
jgi:hypothetical protein